MKSHVTIEEHQAWLTRWRAGRLRHFTSGYQELYETATMYAGDDDVWGWGMGWLMAVAHVLEHMSPDEVPPPAWGYRDSPLCTDATWFDSEDHEQAEIRELYEAGTVADADLIAFGNVISRYLNWCRMAGRDY